jgi:hypothetical protein
MMITTEGKGKAKAVVHSPLPHMIGITTGVTIAAMILPGVPPMIHGTLAQLATDLVSRKSREENNGVISFQDLVRVKDGGICLQEVSSEVHQIHAMEDITQVWMPMVEVQTTFAEFMLAGFSIIKHVLRTLTALVLLLLQRQKSCMVGPRFSSLSNTSTARGQPCL